MQASEHRCCYCHPPPAVIPAAAFVMLACARIGAVHTVVFAGGGGRRTVGVRGVPLASSPAPRRLLRRVPARPHPGRGRKVGRDSRRGQARGAHHPTQGDDGRGRRAVRVRAQRVRLRAHGQPGRQLRPQGCAHGGEEEWGGETGLPLRPAHGHPAKPRPQCHTPLPLVLLLPLLLQPELKAARPFCPAVAQDAEALLFLLYTSGKGGGEAGQGGIIPTEATLTPCHSAQARRASPRASRTRRPATSSLPP